MGFLSNRKALIVGVASNRSIAWGIAEAMHRRALKLRLPIRPTNSKAALSNAPRPAAAALSCRSMSPMTPRLMQSSSS